MFPDSEIPKKFCMNRTKYSYITNFGIAPFFKDVLKKTQLDLVVRCMKNKKVHCQYFTSEFLGQCTAD